MMFLITYGPVEENEQVYNRLDGGIKTMGNWSSRIKNTWLLHARMNASTIRDRLKPLIEERDRLFVARISKNWAGTNMGVNFPEWLKRQEFGTFSNPQSTES